MLGAVDRALAAFPAWVTALPPPARRRLDDTGIARTTIAHPFGLPMVRWLVARFGPAVDAAWDALGADDVERLEEVLALLVARVSHGPCPRCARQAAGPPPG